MAYRAVGTAEVATGQTEPRDFDGALGSGLSRAVVIDLEELEVVEDVAVQIKRCSGGARLERQEGSESLRHGIDTNDLEQRPRPTRPKSASSRCRRLVDSVSCR